MRYEVLSPGKKVKKYRKLVGASQLEIIGQAKTRNTVSLIETDKQNLTYETAKIIAANINEIAKNKGIGMLELTPEYLTQKLNVEVNSIADNYINDLKDIKLTENLEELMMLQKYIEQFMLKYRNELLADKKYNIYKLIAEIYLKLFKYDESEGYALKAYDTAVSMNNIYNIIQIIRMRIIIYYKTDRNTDIVILSKYALSLIENNPIDDYEALASIYYSTALAYNYYNEYNNCIKFLEKMLIIPNLDKNLIINGQIVKANCYLDNKDYKEAEVEYFKILDIAKESDNIVAVTRVYRNLTLCYIGMMEYEKALKYTELTLSIKNPSIEENALTLYYAIHAFKECNDLYNVKKYLFRTLHALNSVNYTSKLINIIIDIFDFLIEKDNSDTIYELANYIYTNMISNQINDERNIMLLYKSACYYMNLKNIDRYNEIYTMAKTLDDKFAKRIGF